MTGSEYQWEEIQNTERYQEVFKVPSCIGFFLSFTVVSLVGYQGRESEVDISLFREKKMFGSKRVSFSSHERLVFDILLQTIKGLYQSITQWSFEIVL